MTFEKRSVEISTEGSYQVVDFQTILMLFEFIASAGRSNRESMVGEDELRIGNMQLVK